MMIKEIDARGLSCPAPVLQTKDVIENGNPSIIKVMVDNEAAKQNVTRFLISRHFDVSVDPHGVDFCITGRRDNEAAACEVLLEHKAVPEEQKIMVMVASDLIGHGDDRLGAKLMVNFLSTLKEMGGELWRLVFVNNGVKLTVSGSESLPILKELQDEGTYIMVCGTCLTHFDLLDKKQVGETTNMLDIVTAMQVATKVINVS